jgi:peroxiredoxin Q/BCP
MGCPLFLSQGTSPEVAHLRPTIFQRDIDKYTAANAVVLGVSVDSADSHKQFCAKEGLNFKLLSDADAKVSETYGSVMELQRIKALQHVNTFIIDPKGNIAKVFVKVQSRRTQAKKYLRL